MKKKTRILKKLWKNFRKKSDEKNYSFFKVQRNALVQEILCKKNNLFF